MLPSDIAWSRLLLASYNICFAILTSSLVFAISLSNSLCFVSNLLHFFCSLFGEAFSCFFLFNSSFSFSSCFLFASSSSCFFAMCERWALYKASHVSFDRVTILWSAPHDLAFSLSLLRPIRFSSTTEFFHWSIYFCCLTDFVQHLHCHFGSFKGFWPLNKE